MLAGASRYLLVVLPPALFDHSSARTCRHNGRRERHYTQASSRSAFRKCNTCSCLDVSPPFFSTHMRSFLAAEPNWRTRHKCARVALSSATRTAAFPAERSVDPGVRLSLRIATDGAADRLILLHPCHELALRGAWARIALLFSSGYRQRCLVGLRCARAQAVCLACTELLQQRWTVPMMLFAEPRMRPRNRAELESRQLNSFRRLARYAHAHSSYYRRIINDRSISLASCSVQDFPVLTKAELIQEFDNIVTVPGITRDRIDRFLRESSGPGNLFEGQYVVITTSGTSGKHNVILYSIADFVSGMNVGEHMSLPTPDGKRKVRVAFVGLSTGHFAGIAMVDNLRRGDNRDLFDLQTIDISKPWKEIVETLNNFKPDWLLGYSAAIRELAGRKQRRELRIFPSLIQCGAETLTKRDRAEIEKAFRAPVLNVYGATECLYLGYGWHHDNMTLFEDTVIFELFSEYTTVTNLFNYTVPLIRYRLDDILTKAAPIDEDHYTHIEELVARNESNLLLENDEGCRECISAGQLLTMDLPGVKKFRCVVANKRHVTIHATFDDRPDNAKKIAAEKLLHDFQELLNKKGLVNIRPQLHEDIEIATSPKTGKYRLVEYVEVPLDGPSCTQAVL
jgi:phenylacetate-CoA ligase